MSDDDHGSMCAEIARRVMGWTATDIPWAYDGETSVWHTAGGDPVMTVYSWRPDRNDAQNMQVLERMLELGFEIALTACRERTVVEFSRDAAPVARNENRDRKTALLRAALAAVGSDVE
ncbi:MAG: hypothetical protein OXU81_16660 [Gammaproteobacteria bacterium]|nr:hypothetical protein [Gammaproteobacteria bacterium]